MELSDIASYADLRRLVSPATFTHLMNYLEWHNQQQQTAPMAIEQAVVVALAFERKPVDRMLYGSIKGFFAEQQPAMPESLENCRTLADQLLQPARAFFESRLELLAPSARLGNLLGQSIELVRERRRASR